MRLIHTLLLLIVQSRMEQDMKMMKSCLKSLEKSTYKTVLVYNQGCLTNDALRESLGGFDLDFHIIGQGTNTGTVVGRQCCFEYIWDNFPKAEYISELHPDMMFTHRWEDALVDYLDNNDEPLISCGIIDKDGNMPFLEKSAALPKDSTAWDEFLAGLRQNSIVHGFSNPCVHVSKILKEVGGYDSRFLNGKQCFEDDSMLLGYYYYYGTKANWYPKINYNSVVYHAVAGQRMGLGDSVMVNYNGLVRQYGAMGLKHLSMLHKSRWHKSFFMQQFNAICNLK